MAVITVLHYHAACDNPARPLAVCGFSSSEISCVKLLDVHELYIALWGNFLRPQLGRTYSNLFDSWVTLQGSATLLSRTALRFVVRAGMYQEAVEDLRCIILLN